MSGGKKQFLRDNALIKTYLLNTVKWLQNSMIEYLKEKEGLPINNDPSLTIVDYQYGSYSKRGQEAIVSRCIQAIEALKDAIFIDCVDALNVVEENSAIGPMCEDVKQWGGFEMPYPSTLLKIDEVCICLIHNVFTEDYPNDKIYRDSIFWNVWVFTINQLDKGEGPIPDPWVPTKIHFQIGHGSEGYGVSFDDAIEDLPEKDRVEIIRTASQTFNGICGFLYLLENRKLKEVSAGVPVHLNAKRIKQGKPPFEEYKVAVLGDYVSKDKKESHGGTHASPKMHMVIGFWRHFSKKTKLGLWERWIPSCVRGDPSKGIVVKEYRVMEIEDD